MPTINLRALAVLLAACALTAGAHAASGPADHDQMLRQLIEGAARGHVAYQAMAPDLADAVRPQASVAQSELSALGALKSVTLQTIDPQGREIYRTVFEKGALDWAFHVNGQGLIDNAIYRPAKIDP